MPRRPNRAVLMVSALAMALGALVSGTGGPAKAAVPDTFRVYQMNMCAWGAKYYISEKQPSGDKTCFKNPLVTTSDPDPGTPEATEKEKQVAGVKRQDVIDHVSRFRPDAVTLNEVCAHDLTAIVEQLSRAGITYHSRAFETGRSDNDGPRECTVERGAAVNGMLTRAPVSAPSGRTPEGYFESQPAGHPDPRRQNRSYVCGMTAGVRVCTAHLSLPGQQDGDGHDLGVTECRFLRDEVLGTPVGSAPTVFAGDTNIHTPTGNHLCMPRGFRGLQDNEYDKDKKKPQSGFDHIYYSAAPAKTTPEVFTRAQTCGATYEVPNTDHSGFLLDLHRTTTAQRGKACGVREISRPSRAVHPSAPSGWATYGDGRYNLVRIGGGRHLYQDWTSASGTWTGWHSHGRTFGGTPAFGYHAGRYDIYALAPGGGVWQRTYKDAKWGAWHAVWTRAKTPVRAKPGTGLSTAWIGSGPRIFSIGASGQVIQSYYDSSGWHSQALGAPSGHALTGTPAVAYDRHGRVDVFATDGSGRVYQRTYRNGWDTWHADVTAAGNTITAKAGTGVSAQSGMGRMRLFTVSPAGHLVQSWYDYDSGWHSQSLGGGLAGTPSVVINGARLDVFAAAPSGNVFQRTYADGRWGGFHVIAYAP